MDGFTTNHFCQGQKNAGLSIVKPVKELRTILDSSKNKKQIIHFLPLYRPENKIKLQNLIGILPNDIQNKFSVDLVKAVVSQREIKDEEEIKELHHAVNVSVDMHVAAMKTAKPGMTEAQVTAEIHKVALAAGG